MRKKDPSDNAVKHGCRSRKMRFVAGEDPEDFTRMQQRWIERFEPSDDAELEIVNQLIFANWLQQRAAREFEDLQFQLSERYESALDWAPEHASRFALLLRYKTSEQNGFHKALRAAEAMQKSEAHRIRHTEQIVKAICAEAALPEDHKQFKQQVRKHVEAPPALRVDRNDGGCTCPWCLRDWGIRQSKEKNE